MSNNSPDTVSHFLLQFSAWHLHTSQYGSDLLDPRRLRLNITMDRSVDGDCLATVPGLSWHEASTVQQVIQKLCKLYFVFSLLLLVDNIYYWCASTTLAKKKKKKKKRPLGLCIKSERCSYHGISKDQAGLRFGAAMREVAASRTSVPIS